MKNKTKFYKLLVKARTDEVSLIFVIDKIMPLIDKYSKNENKEVDQELKSYLIEYAVRIIKDKDFAEKLAK
ncbi:MAG: hypothetical protein HFJ30_08580 [Clostridia bacterium]|jgi:hypothetical protein|nr:hypothetical protein [Clostridia bacterium]